MPRLLDGQNVEFSKSDKDEIFLLNEKNAPRGCVGYWCERCHFSSAFRRYFQVDHIIPVADAKTHGMSADDVCRLDNACVLCNGCNGSKNKYKDPREGVGLAYRLPNQNMTWGPLRKQALDWDELVQMAMRKGRFRRQS